MSFYVRNKSRSCTVGRPDNPKERKVGQRECGCGGRTIFLPPGDVRICEDRSTLNSLTNLGDRKFVFCADPKEMDELGVPASVRTKDGHGFLGTQFVVEDATRTLNDTLAGGSRGLSAQRLAELEKSSLEASVAVTRAQLAESERDRLRKENEEMRKQLAEAKAARGK